MARTSTSRATWDGTLQEGKGRFEAGSGAFKGTYTAGTRFGDNEGTNPEELIAAALASCFSMALAAALAKDGHAPRSIATTAHCTMDTVDGKPTVTTIRLETRGTVPGIDEAAFRQAAEGTKTGCPVSRALTGVKISVDAKLAG